MAKLRLRIVNKYAREYVYLTWTQIIAWGRSGEGQWLGGMGEKAEK